MDEEMVLLPTDLEPKGPIAHFCACVYSVCKKRTTDSNATKTGKGLAGVFGFGGFGGFGGGGSGGGMGGSGGDTTTLVMACSLVAVVAFCVGYKLGSRKSAKD